MAGTLKRKWPAQRHVSHRGRLYRQVERTRCEGERRWLAQLGNMAEADPCISLPSARRPMRRSATPSARQRLLGGERAEKALRARAVGSRDRLCSSPRTWISLGRRSSPWRRRRRPRRRACPSSFCSSPNLRRPNQSLLADGVANLGRRGALRGRSPDRHDRAQRRRAAREAHRVPGSRCHLGDVVEESDGDLMGDGVNIVRGFATDLSRPWRLLHRRRTPPSRSRVRMSTRRISARSSAFATYWKVPCSAIENQVRVNAQLIDAKSSGIFGRSGLRQTPRQPLRRAGRHRRQSCRPIRGRVDGQRGAPPQTDPKSKFYGSLFSRHGVVQQGAKSHRYCPRAGFI